MITKLIRVEEESFAKTIDQGLQILEKLIDHAEIICYPVKMHSA